MQPLNTVLIDRLPDSFRTQFLELRSLVLGSPGTIETLKMTRRSLAQIKSNMLKVDFASPEEEILFFKIIKPLFHGLLIYSSAVFELELLKPLGGRKTELRFLRKQLRRLHWFFEQHTVFFAYYRSGQTSLDHRYFMRKRNQEGEEVFSFSLEVDHSYSTEKDRLVAKMMGYERLQEYIEKQMVNLVANVERSDNPFGKSTLQWTASKASLVELIYALQSSGVYNHGKSEVKIIAETFQKLFQVDLGNYYGVFNEIRLRKKNRTSLLDDMRLKVLQRMDELDDK